MQVSRSELILGGQKSGKSRRAELLARDWLAQSPAHHALLIATAQPWDGEMRERIARHQRDRAERVPGLQTLEEPRDLAAALAQSDDPDRQKLLFDAEIAARKDYEAAQQSLASASADARAATDRLAQLGADVQASSRGSYVIKSPISGRVVEMAGSQGGYWNDVNASVMTVADLSKVWLSASVPERDLAYVDVGQEAHIALTAYPDLKLEGRVQYVGEIVDTATRSVKVRVAVDNREGRLRPGMFARVSFDGPGRDTLMVPTTALLQGNVSARVFVDKGRTDKGARFEPRDVQVGVQQDGKVEIRSGLAAGERIVVNGGVLLQ